jgi:hypothetical protein
LPTAPGVEYVEAGVWSVAADAPTATSPTAGEWVREEYGGSRAAGRLQELDRLLHRKAGVPVPTEAFLALLDSVESHNVGWGEAWLRGESRGDALASLPWVDAPTDRGGPVVRYRDPDTDPGGGDSMAKESFVAGEQGVVYYDELGDSSDFDVTAPDFTGGSRNT